MPSHQEPRGGIAVLYTTYVPLYGEQAWQNNVAPFTNGIAAPMQSCASPGLYFEVSLTQGVSEAMSTLFFKVLRQSRLTQ